MGCIEVEKVREELAAGWMVLWVSGRFEFAVAEWLDKEEAAEVFAPKAKLRVYVRHLKRVEDVDRPVFAGFIFARRFEVGVLRRAPNRPRVACSEGVPMMVRDREIERIRREVAEGKYGGGLPREARWKKGDLATIHHESPLGGLEVRVVTLPRSLGGEIQVEMLRTGWRTGLDASLLVELPRAA